MATKREKSPFGQGIEARYNKAGAVVGYKFRTCVGRDDEDKQVWKVYSILADDPRIAELTPAKRKRMLLQLKGEWDEEQKREYSKNKDATDKRKITFAKFVSDHWMKDHVIPGHTPSSIEFFEYTSKKAVEYFGEKRKLQSIDTEDVKRYLAMMDITKKWTGRRQDWSVIYAQLVVFFGNRIPE